MSDLPPDIREKVQEIRARHNGRSGRPLGPRIQLPGNAVSPRESDVADLVAEGLTNKEIGIALSIGTETVRTHVESMLKRTGSRNRAHLAVRWIREELIVVERRDGRLVRLRHA